MIARFAAWTGIAALAAAPALGGGGADGRQHWPTWRGPMMTGEAPAADPPLTWSESRNIRWKVRIPGSGNSSPVIWGERLFVATAVPVNQGAPGAAPAPLQRRGGGGFGGGAAPSHPYRMLLLCLDRNTGKTLWEQVATEQVPHEGHHQDHGYASHSPVTDGEVVLAYFGSRGLYCYSLDGVLKWKKDLGRMRTRNGFGEGSSPALAARTVVINWDHEGEDFIVALDRDTGRELWRQVREEPTTWGTPLVVRHEDGHQVITNGTQRVRSYDLATGQLLWEHVGLTPNSIPSPVAREGVVYAMAGFRGSALHAIRLGRKGDLTGTDAVLWSHGRNTPYVPSPLLSGHRLYFYSGNQAILTCFDVRSGKPLIEAERIAGLAGVYASPVAAAGRVYLVGRNGVTVVIRDADQVEVLATNRLEEGIDASPAAVGAHLYLRGRQHLYCIGPN